MPAVNCTPAAVDVALAESITAYGVTAAMVVPEGTAPKTDCPTASPVVEEIPSIIRFECVLPVKTTGGPTRGNLVSFSGLFAALTPSPHMPPVRRNWSCQVARPKMRLQYRA